jgi:putative phosphoribosyl transferase
MVRVFANRREAGRVLVDELLHLRAERPVVVGIPRGGVPVARVVADSLSAPLDVIVVRKLGVPWQPEVAMGAIGEDGIRVIDDRWIAAAQVTRDQLAEVEARERAELDRRVRAYRGDRPRLSLENRTVIIVDDGVATGSTAEAACRIARAEGAERIVLAVPVAPDGWVHRMGDAADEYIAVQAPVRFSAVGQFYDDFSASTEADVIDALDGAGDIEMETAPIHGGAGGIRWLHDTDVELRAGSVTLHGRLSVPVDASGLVIFVHGSGSSRHSPRNRYVASVLNAAGMATLLFDLLTDVEERDRVNVFDIELLSGRLGSVTAELRTEPTVAGLPIGYFGASTGAAAALWAAADPDNADVVAVVSRGGRPDLAEGRLASVAAPTLLIVGELDTVVIGLNRQALDQLRCRADLAIVPGATHLFEEPGTLAHAASLARSWFSDAFGAPGT